MDPRRDPLELSILYDTARGFLGLQSREQVLGTALLSLMGAVGARYAVHLFREAPDLLVLEAGEGVIPAGTRELRLTGRAASLLDEARDPLTGDRLDALGTRTARAIRAMGLEMLSPMRRPGAGRSVLALGPKLLGEPYGERDVAVVREVTIQAAKALGAPRAGSPAADRVEAMRRAFPPLRAIRGESASTASLFAELVGLSDFDLPVLVLGETGTGKELVAHAIHDLSARRDAPFEAINCAAIPRDLMASALFGHEKGAFTGADAMVPGAFERAGDGTIFLDEIGDMPLDTQAMLLRVLEERGFRRVGGTTLLPAKARVISATNRDLLREVEEGRFRRDLFYRLQMYTVRIAPLRERAEEIPTLAAHVFESLRAAGRGDVTASSAFLDALRERKLAGNVRELESLIAGAIVRAGGSGELRPEHLEDERAGGVAAEVAGNGAFVGTVRGLPRPGEGAVRDGGDAGGGGRGEDDEEAAVPSWEAMERNYIRSVLQRTGGNRKRAAQLMGIPRTTLSSKLRRFGID